MITLQIDDDGFGGHQLREAAREHGYADGVEQFLREVVYRSGP